MTSSIPEVHVLFDGLNSSMQNKMRLHRINFTLLNLVKLSKMRLHKINFTFLNLVKLSKISTTAIQMPNMIFSIPFPFFSWLGFVFCKNSSRGPQSLTLDDLWSIFKMQHYPPQPFILVVHKSLVDNFTHIFN